MLAKLKNHDYTVTNTTSVTPLEQAKLGQPYSS